MNLVKIQIKKNLAKIEIKKVKQLGVETSKKINNLKQKYFTRFINNNKVSLKGQYRISQTSK